MVKKKYVRQVDAHEDDNVHVNECVGVEKARELERRAERADDAQE